MINYFNENVDTYNEIARGMLEFDEGYVNAYIDNDKFIFGNGEAGSIPYNDTVLEQK